MATLSVSAEIVRDRWVYNPDTGEFRWRLGRSANALSGALAGSLRKDGYLVLRINKRAYLAHRIAWCYVYGAMPEKFIDHINGNPRDNRICNLRQATQAENLQNMVRRKIPNKHGFPGIGKHRNKFIANISINNKTRYLGLFFSAEEAHAAYVKEKKKLHPFSPESLK